MPLPNLLHDYGKIGDETGISGDETFKTFRKSDFFVGKWYQHLIGITAFVTYEVTIVKVLGNDSGLLDLVSTYGLDISLFYINGILFIPFIARLWWRNHPILFGLLLLAGIAVECALQLGINHLMRAYYKGPFSLNTSKEQWVRAIWRSIYVMGMGWAYWTAVYNHLRSKANHEILLRKKEVERENIILENAYLQARIEPHFLFNTLNFIYYSALENSKQTAPAIAELSDMMRYVLAAPGSDGKIELREELECIDRFIGIVQLRFGDLLRLDYTVHISEKEKTVRIPPHILMTFIENMVKHGVLMDEEVEARISIQFEDAHLVLYTYNKKSVSENPNSLGSGITNAIKRLEYHYPDAYLLIRKDDKTIFEITLKIKL